VRQLAELIRDFGWEPILIVVGCLALLFVWLVVFLVYAAGKHNVSIETRFTPLFNLRIGATESSTSPRKLAALTRSNGRDAPEFSRHLREFRLKRKIRQADMAKLLDVEASFISLVERGKEQISADQLEVILREYGVTGEQATRLRDSLRRSRRPKA